MPFKRPRGLRANERELLEFLVGGPLGCEVLRRQIRSARVTGRCRCGCPSITLETDAPELRATEMKQRSEFGRDDVLEIPAVGRNRAGKRVEVTLHVVYGRIWELEIWAGWDGGEVRTDVPDVTTLVHGSD